MSGGKVYLNIGALQERSVVNGPGNRFVIWVQGCPIRCPGCINPELWSFSPRNILPVDEVFERILKVKDIEGVTYTGGEPFAQAKALALLGERLKEEGLSVVCYTGYLLEDLKMRHDPWIARLLSVVDVLIDGPFIEELRAPLLWRGSTNQRVHFLTRRYAHLSNALRDREMAECEFTVSPKGLVTTGFWPEALLSKLLQKVRGRDENSD